MTSKRFWTVAVLLVLIAVALGATLFQVSRARCFSLVGEAVCRVDTQEPLVALTFDDGPTPEGVEVVTRELERYQAKGTFFLIGSSVPDNEALVRRLLANGHEVGNHSFSHRRMALHLASFYEREITQTDRLLREAGVPHPTLFRPPYGKKLVGLPHALQRHGYRMIMWEVEDPADAKDAADYARQVLAEVRPGSIILMHVMYSSNRTAREALPLILEGLERKGLRSVTVSELLAQNGEVAA